MRRTRYTGFLILILIILLCFQKQIPDWPRYVVESLWVPQGAKDAPRIGAPLNWYIRPQDPYNFSRTNIAYML